MKKTFLFISILLLALLPVYCSGSSEENPIMQLFQRSSSKVLNQETKEPETLSQMQSKVLSKPKEISVKQVEQSMLSSEDLAALKNLQNLVNKAENTVSATKEDLIKANEQIIINQEKIDLLNNEDTRKSNVIENLEKDKKALSLDNSKKAGRIEELEKIHGSKKSFEIGCLYNMNSGFQAGFDLGYKFEFGLKTSVGAYIPVEDTIKNPLTLLKPEAYTFSARIGWEF